MLKTIIKYTTPFIILIGTILIAFGISNFAGATVIENHTLTYGNFTWNYKTFNMQLYLQNLENSLQINALEGIIPNQPELPSTPNNADILGWVKFIGSLALQYVVNWIVYALNWLLLAPLKIILYPINMILTILGLNTTNEGYIATITSLYTWQLPYIPNF